MARHPFIVVFTGPMLLTDDISPTGMGSDVTRTPGGCGESMASCWAGFGWG